MRLTVITPLAERLGGSENMLWHILRHSSPAGLEPRVICLQDGPFVQELHAAGIPVAVVETGRVREPHRGATAMARLTRRLRRDAPDIVLSWLPKAQLYGGLACRAAGLEARAVWWQHNIAGAWIDRLATALPAAAVGCSSHVVADSQRRLRPRRPTFVVHPGVDSAPGPERLTARDLGIPGDRAVVSVVGRLQHGKGQHRVLEAVCALRERGIDMHLLVVGGDAHGLSPKYAARIRQLVGELGLEDRTTLTGHVASALPYIALSDVLVNACEHEAFGMVLIEAMMAGTPVVAVARGGPSEIIEHERSGLLLADGRPATIAAGLARVLVDEALRERLAAGGRRRAAERFSAEAMTRRLGDALRAIANGSTGARGPR